MRRIITFVTIISFQTASLLEKSIFILCILAGTGFCEVPVEPCPLMQEYYSSCLSGPLCESETGEQGEPLLLVIVTCTPENTMPCEPAGCDNLPCAPEEMESCEPIDCVMPPCEPEMAELFEPIECIIPAGEQEMAAFGNRVICLIPFSSQEVYRRGCNDNGRPFSIASIIKERRDLAKDNTPDGALISFASIYELNTKPILDNSRFPGVHKIIPTTVLRL